MPTQQLTRYRVLISVGGGTPATPVVVVAPSKIRAHSLAVESYREYHGLGPNTCVMVAGSREVTP